MDPYSSILMLILALFLVFLNAFFVLSEFAIVKIRKSKLEELAKNEVKNASLALKITHSLDTYLSATQLGITLASLALGWISENAFVKLISIPFGYLLESSPLLVHSIASMIAFVFVTLLHVVLGELVPMATGWQLINGNWYYFQNNTSCHLSVASQLPLSRHYH